MSQASLELALPPYDRLLLDTSALIGYLSGRDLVTPVITEIIDTFVRTGRNPAIVSMVTVMELLVRPLRAGAGEPYRHVLDFLTRFPNLRAVELDLPIAQEAASLRASYRLSAPDALIVATGTIAQVGHLVTNDKLWASRLQPIQRRIHVVDLSKHLPFP